MKAFDFQLVEDWSKATEWDRFFVVDGNFIYQIRLICKQAEIKLFTWHLLIPIICSMAILRVETDSMFPRILTEKY